MLGKYKKHSEIKRIISITVISVVILTAIFVTNSNESYAAIKKPKVKYEVNKGKFLSNKHKNKKIIKKVIKNKKIGKPPKVYRPGYWLKGWYTKKKGGRKITVKTKITKNKTLYARWSKRSYPNKKAVELYKMVNAERKKRGLKKLDWCYELEKSAKTRAKELTVDFSHTRPNGRSGVSINELAHGENLAYGYNKLDDAGEVLDTFLDSPSHRNIIMNPDYEQVAIAKYREGNSYYWVQLFTLKP